MADKTFYQSQLGTNTIPSPQGRLTLSSNTPVMTADATAQTIIYYTPYVGNIIPVSNGSILGMVIFSQLLLTLDSNSAHTGYQQSGNLFDLFIFNNSGAITLATGPAWTNSTTRAINVSQLNGVWTNNVTITLKIDATATTVSVGANQATYVGTMYATANGQTGMQFSPSAIAGGPNAVRGIWNAYNRVHAVTMAMDNTSSWTYASSTPRSANASNSNRITFVDGLAQSPFTARYHNVPNATGATGTSAYVGVGINSTSTFSGVVGYEYVDEGFPMCSGWAVSSPILGLSFVQALEASQGNTANFFGTGTGNSDQTQGLFLKTEY